MQAYNCADTSFWTVDKEKVCECEYFVMSVCWKEMTTEGACLQNEGAVLLMLFQGV